ncbi:CoA pyrophosphatase [Undibacterium sp. Ji67W]|uniref:CoA pyrophosphatase n=1 Tax=Undibacterium sp. Ji67W TaxID=3413042 RepID=UPI003BF1636E
MSKLIFDPEILPIVSVANEEAVPPEMLTPEQLKQRFKEAPIWTPEIQMEESFFKGLSFRPASVLIPLVLRDGGLTVLLTQRATGLNHHAGQISFPGGRFETSDVSTVETALRETEEEIGLGRHHIDVLGNLPEYKTGTGYLVTPVVSLVHPPFDLITDPAEVAAAFEVPLAYLMNGQHHQRRVFQMPDGSGQRSFYAMPYQQHFIWGATAGMLRNLFHFLRA